jgi:hypothetical protein
MEDLNWKYVAITAAVALVVCLVYDRVLRDYIPGGKDDDM